jgi:sugar-specific transcriptional regulator TrmB
MMMEHRAGLVEALCALGFTTYEARTYTGLLAESSQTAYGLSKITGVPQPKIYEVLRKLEARKAAVLVHSDPQKFSATPPAELLLRLRAEFEARMDSADTAVAVALSENGTLTETPEVMTGLTGRVSVVDAARKLIASAQEKVYMSGWIPELAELTPEIKQASNNGVFFVTLGFGKGKAFEPNGHFYRHASTLNTVYHHHQNRHFALVVDGRSILWATCTGDIGWTGLLADDQRLVGLVRTYIRHDIYVQKIYSRFGSELEDTFGAGLELLTNVAEDLDALSLSNRGSHVKPAQAQDAV